ncbi:hypothetical protein ACFLWS_06500 [Chloroflexota bacterium]
MPKKRSTETSSLYGSFLVSLLYRSLELMDTGGRVSQPAATLDKALGSIFEILEIKEIVTTLLEQINSTLDVEWIRGARKFILQGRELAP